MIAEAIIQTASWLFVYLLWRNIYSSPLPFVLFLSFVWFHFVAPIGLEFPK
jgi:hypothetical protein